MGDFDLTSAKLKEKYERKANKTNTINAVSPSEDKYPSEKGFVEYVDELRDYIKGT